MPLLPGNYCIFGATVFSTARIPPFEIATPFEIAIGEAGIGLNEIERAAGDGAYARRSRDAQGARRIRRAGAASGRAIFLHRRNDDAGGPVGRAAARLLCPDA